jgi:hypothetical protein
LVRTTSRRAIDQPADFDQFQTQTLQPVDHSVQRGLVDDRAAQNRPYWLDRHSNVLDFNEHVGWHQSRDPDLIVKTCHWLPSGR